MRTTSITFTPVVYVDAGKVGKFVKPEYTRASGMVNMSFVGNVKIIHTTGLMDSESTET